MLLKQFQRYLQAEVAKYVDVREVKSIVDILLEKRAGYNALAVNLYPQTILPQNVLFQVEQDLKLLAIPFLSKSRASSNCRLII